MKKDTIYKIYDLYKDNPQLITDNLKEFLILDNYSDNILYEIMCVNKNVINEDNIKEFIDLAYSIGKIQTQDFKNEILERIKEMLSNDYVSNDAYINEIIGAICYLLNYEYWEDFECVENSDIDFYKSFTVNNLIDILESNSKIGIENMYSHNTSFILDNFTKLLHEIGTSESSDNSLSENDIKIRRINNYKEVLSNLDIAKLDNKKYSLVTKVAGSICNIEKLKSFKNIVLFNRLKTNSEFAEKLDDYALELNKVTIDRIVKKLGIKKMPDEETGEILTSRKNYDDEYEVNTIKKILKPNKNA